MNYFSYNEITKVVGLLIVLFISLFVFVAVDGAAMVINGEVRLMVIVARVIFIVLLAWIIISPIINAIESTYRPFLVNGVTYPLMQYEKLYLAINSVSGTYYTKNVTFTPDHALLCIFSLDVYPKINHFMRLYVSIYNSIHKVGINLKDDETYRNMKFALGVVKDLDLTVNNLAVMSLRHKALAYLVRRQILIAIGLFTAVVKIYEAKECTNESAVPN